MVVESSICQSVKRKSLKIVGQYIDKGNMGFREARKGEYIDKSGLIAIVNGTLGSKNKFSCVSRARRFGKSMAAEMLCA